MRRWPMAVSKNRLSRLRNKMTILGIQIHSFYDCVTLGAFVGGVASLVYHSLERVTERFSN